MALYKERKHKDMDTNNILIIVIIIINLFFLFFFCLNNAWSLKTYFGPRPPPSLSTGEAEQFSPCTLKKDELLYKYTFINAHR